MSVLYTSITQFNCSIMPFLIRGIGEVPNKGMVGVPGKSVVIL